MVSAFHTTHMWRPLIVALLIVVAVSQSVDGGVGGCAISTSILPSGELFLNSTCRIVTPESQRLEARLAALEAASTSASSSPSAQSPISTGLSARVAALEASTSVTLPTPGALLTFEGDGAVGATPTTIANTGTYGSTAAVTGDPSIVAAAGVRPGRVLSLNGINQAMRFANGGASGLLTTFTAAMWIKWDGHSDGNGRTYVMCWQGTSGGGWWIVDGDNTMHLQGNGVEVEFPFTPATGTWEHWALVSENPTGTCSAGRNVFYRNGEYYNEVAGCSKAGANTVVGTYASVFSSSSTPYYMDASIDDVYFAHAAFTGPMVRSLMQSTASHSLH